MLPLQRLWVCTVVLLLSGAAGAAADRAVTVSGTGVVTATPDIARLQLAIVERNPTVAGAQTAAGAVTARMLELLDKLGIDRKHVNTTGASIQPDYRWDREKEQQQLVGYIAQRDIQVELRDLDKLGELIEGAVKAGVNQVQPPILDSSRRRDAYRQALTIAANDARQNAATLAAAMGARLGKVITIDTSETPDIPRPMMRMQSDMAMAEAAPETYNAGDIRFEAQLTAVFELAD